MTRPTTPGPPLPPKPTKTTTTINTSHLHEQDISPSTPSFERNAPPLTPPIPPPRPSPAVLRSLSRAHTGDPPKEAAAAAASEEPKTYNGIIPHVGASTSAALKGVLDKVVGSVSGR